jgi:hypothetical protein
MSVFVPVDRSLPQPAGLEKAAKPLLQQVRAAVPDPRLADTLVAELEALLAEPLEPAAHGVALFATAGRMVRLDLAGEVAPAAFVAGVPVLVPLVPLAEPTVELFVLVLGRHDVRLYALDRTRIDEVAVEGLPRSIEDDLWYEQHEPSMNRHGGPRDAGVAGVVGGGTSERDLRKAAFERFAHHVAKALRPVLAANRHPLVVAALPHDAAAFRAACDHEPLVVMGEGTDLDATHLRAAALVAAAPLLEAPTATALGRFASKGGTGLTETDPVALTEMAGAGRVATLLVAVDAPDPVMLAPAVAAAYRTGAAVLPVAMDRLQGLPIGALLRY